MSQTFRQLTAVFGSGVECSAVCGGGSHVDHVTGGMQCVMTGDEVCTV